MADYDTFPIWDASPGQIGNVDPSTLQISVQLQSDLTAWAQAFNRTLHHVDPMNSGFVGVEEEEKFKADGRALGDRLQAELGADFLIKAKV